jgi:hypothetical protein
MDWLVIPKMNTRNWRYSEGLEFAHISDSSASATKSSGPIWQGRNIPSIEASILSIALKISRNPSLTSGLAPPVSRVSMTLTAPLTSSAESLTMSTWVRMKPASELLGSRPRSKARTRRRFGYSRPLEGSARW